MVIPAGTRSSEIRHFAQHPTLGIRRAGEGAELLQAGNGMDRTV